jgi:anti-sigma factor RsiW
MACDRCDDRLSAHLDGESEHPEEIEAHLAACATCRRTLAELELGSRVLALDPPAPDPWFVVRFLRRLEAIELERTERWRLLALRLMPLAATALVAALALTAVDGRGSAEDESFTALERTVLAAGSPPLREMVPNEAAGTELVLAGAVDSRSIGGLRRAAARYP